MPKIKIPAAQELLATLCDMFGPSGHEDDVRDYVLSLIRPAVSEWRVDAAGNLIAVIPGRNSKKLMVDAHMDEVGIMVRHIDDKGFLRFAKLGGWDDRMFPGHRVTLRTRQGEFYHGVIGMAPPHVLTDDSKNKTIKAEDYFIDIGASSADEASERGVNVGDPGILDGTFHALSPDHFVGKAFDDRAGCALLVMLIGAIANGSVKTPMTVVANFATGEELGLRGARTAAYSIDPDIALALEGTIGSDFPGVPAERRPCVQGGGPVLTMIDNTIFVPRRVSNFMIDCAEKAEIPYQIKMPIYGGTDAGAIHQTRGGVPTGILSVPCRYIHSPSGTLYWPDFDLSWKLVQKIVPRIHTLVE